MTDEQIIMTAMHVNDSTRDAIRWAMKQVRMQANTHQSPSVSEPNTHKPDAVVRQLVEALSRMTTVFLDTDGSYGSHETDAMDFAEAALAAAKDAGL